MTDMDKTKRQICEFEYGYIPPRPEHLSVSAVNENRTFLGGKGRFAKLNFTVTIKDEQYTFPVCAINPHGENMPAFLLITEEDEPYTLIPTEEILDGGFALFILNFHDVAAKGKKISKLERALIGRRRTLTSPSKCAAVAFAAMRIMDYIESSPFYDSEKAAVIGHSRFGRLAMLVGAFDERFKFVIANEFATPASGALGAHFDAMEELSANYTKRALKGIAPPYDTKTLATLIPPRFIFIGSARSDEFSDTQIEKETAIAAKRECERLGYADNCVHYHVRNGMHFLGREDFLIYMDAMRKIFEGNP